MISQALERNLKRQWINIKPNFIKLLGEFEGKLNNKWFEKVGIELIIKEASRKIFIILNRANSNRRIKDTSPITSIYSRKVLWLQNTEKIMILKKISQSNIFQSITCMQHWKWMIRESDFNKLIELCTKEGILDKNLLSSVTWMQAWKWMIEEKDFKKLIELCSWWDNILDKELLRSITSMQNGLWMIEEEDFYTLIELCTQNNILDKDKLILITQNQHWKWMILEKDFYKIIK